MDIELKKKKSNLKKIILGSFLGILIGSVFGVTVAMFTYNSSSINNKLIAGDIYMRYKETSAINLNGAMPSATYPTTASGNYFEFQIIGKNTNTTKDITYNVKLAYGDTHGTRTTRIDDEYLIFKLVEVVNGVEQTPALVEDQSFDTIPGATLYTTTIPKNTTNETTRTFRVYARINEEVGIGTNTTYTIQEWNNLYASVKINVDGGFVNASPSQTTGAQMLISTYGTENAGGLVGINKNGELYDPNATGTSNNTNNVLNNNLVNKNNDATVSRTDANDTVIREYRYSGIDENYVSEVESAEIIESVKNYIWFNDENWRIVGIFDKTDDTFGNGNDEPVIKIVKDEPLSEVPSEYERVVQGSTQEEIITYYLNYDESSYGDNLPYSQVYWSNNYYDDYDDWAIAGLQYYLNDENNSNSYYSSISNNYKEFIDTTTYYLGNVSTYEVTPSMSYTQERNIDDSNLSSAIPGFKYPGTWTGKIGLLYPSDWGYASDPTIWNGTNTPMYEYSRSGSPLERNWTLKSIYYNGVYGVYWLFSSCWSMKLCALFWTDTGSFGDCLVSRFDGGEFRGVHPALNLKSNTQIVSGDGSYDNPYRIIAE